MRGVPGRNMIVAVAVAGALVAGGGVAYALTPTSQERIAALEAPDGTQPTGDELLSPSPSSIASPAEQSPTPTPSATTAAPTSTPPKPPASKVAGCESGEKQREVETYLARISGYGDVTVDGQQSDADCAAIRRFQSRFGISPANGRAGATTADVARRISISVSAEELAKCGAGAGLSACVDLTTQTMWVVRDGAVVFGPTVMRTGMKGYATPAGTYSVFNRSPKAWSTPYKVWLYYWQNFVRGIGFHSTTTYLHDMGRGSHGCVNLLAGDAKTLYSTIGQGTTVRVFGRRPGT